MHLVPAVNITAILNSLLCFGGFALVASLVVWAAVKEARLKKGREMPFEDVPQHVRAMLGRLAPNLTVERVVVKFRKKDVPRKYEFHGRLDGTLAEVEIMPRESAPHIREAELIYDTGYRRLHQGELVKLAKVPPRVTQSALDHMESLGTPIEQVDRARVGHILEKTAYELKGDWTGGRFEMKVLAKGEVVKVELKFRAPEP